MAIRIGKFQGMIWPGFLWPRARAALFGAAGFRDDNYSYYRAAANTVGTYDAGDPSMFLGVPSHKVAANVSVRALAGLSLNLSGSVISERKGYRYPETGIATFAAERLFSLFAEYLRGGFSIAWATCSIRDASSSSPTTAAPGRCRDRAANSSCAPATSRESDSGGARRTQISLASSIMPIPLLLTRQ
jgi:hypothetical protein